MTKKVSPEAKIRNIRRKTRRQYTAEEKIRIVLEGLQSDSTIAELCRRERINQNLYYRWSKEFLEAGRKRLIGDTMREANSSEVAVKHRPRLLSDNGPCYIAAELKKYLAGAQPCTDQTLRALWGLID